MQRSGMTNGRGLDSLPHQPQGAPSRRGALAWIVASLAWARGAQAGSPGTRPAEVAIGEALSDGALTGLNGPSHRLSDFRGHPLIINVWASWCGPCRQEMASLERLAWRGDARAFAIIGISTDDDAAAAKRLLASTNATIDHFIDQRLFWESMLGASRLPLTVLVDARGRVVGRVVGAQQWDGPDAAKLIERAFDGTAR
jgi:thiol-disulfide isomerase/thioredoxin